MLASKIFAAADQTKFAALTGDYNPIHMDPVAARRTVVGSPVVHGIHTLLWLIDNVGAKHTDIDNVVAVKARFFKPVHLGDLVEAWVVQLGPTSLRVQARVTGAEVISVVVTLGAPLARPPQLLTKLTAETVGRQGMPADLTLGEMENRTGRLLFTKELAGLGKEFPGATRLLGASRVEALGCSTYLIGMVVPGLHSIYAGLDLRLFTDADISNELQYTVTTVDPRLRRVELKVQGAGVSGVLNAFARVPPVLQPPMDAVAEHVTSGEFAKSTALVVGGSRGLGEITGKLIAAGGGRVIITYARGKTDAENLAGEINAWGGRCEIAAYDIHKNADEQLEALKRTPTHLYYFATPMIFGGNANYFSRERFAEFNEFYVHGFARLVEATRRRAPEGIAVFYPSSVFVQNRPRHMTEYAMSKAAGEILCVDIARSCKDVRVLAERLPRLRTDQTSTLIQVDAVSAVPIMLSIVRAMHAGNRSDHDVPVAL